MKKSIQLLEDSSLLGVNGGKVLEGVGGGCNYTLESIQELFKAYLVKFASGKGKVEGREVALSEKMRI